MKTHKLPAHFLVLACLSLLPFSRAAVYTYDGNGNTGANGAIGQGTLELSDSGSTIRGTVTLGGGRPENFTDYLVLYIDSKPGGFADTTSFSDASTAETRTISGFSGGARATANFAPNFGADYAIVLSRTGSAHSLYELASGTAQGPSKNISFSDSGYNKWQFSFDLNDIGASEAYFKFQSTCLYSGGAGYRSLESYESLTGNPGFYTVTFGNFNTFGVDSVPETTNAALAVFGGLALAVGVATRVRGYMGRKGQGLKGN